MKAKFNVRSKKMGQSLIEVVVALAIAAILAISIISTSLVTQKTGQSAENNTIATKLAQEGVERIRVFRDRNSFVELTEGCRELNEVSAEGDFNLSLDPCTDQGAGKFGKHIRLENTNFYRKIIIEDEDPTRKLIKVIIVWDESGGEKSIENTTFLSDWEQL